jgi:hypothetical protein
MLAGSSPVRCRLVAAKTHDFFSYLLVILQKNGLKRGNEFTMHQKMDLQVKLVFL